MKRVVFVLLSLPAIATASFLASVSYRTADCRHSVFDSGEFTALASLDCGTDSVVADGSFDGTWFRLHTAGRYDQGAVRGSADGQSTFDFPVVITGTEQPGYVVIFFDTDISPITVAPTRYQWVDFWGTGLPEDWTFQRAGYGYIPYTPGVPFLLSATVRGAGINGTGDQRGEFDISLELRIAGFTSHFPLEGEPWQLSQVEGAQAVVVPEPVSIALVILALVALKAYASPRARPRST